MGRSSQEMFKSLSKTFDFLTNMEKEFSSLKNDASRLKSINKEMHEDYVSFSSVHLKKAVA